MPPTIPRPFPNLWQAACLLLTMLVVEYLVSAVVWDLRGLMGFAEAEAWAYTSVLSNAILFVALMHWQGWAYRPLFHASRASPQATLALLSPPVLALVPALVLSAWGMVAAASSWWPPTEAEQAMFEAMAALDVATIVTTCVLAPVLEEMLFRGVILRGFLQLYPRWQAIVASSMLFGAAHLNIYQFLAATLLGVLAGWLYERTRSLWPCIVLHAGYNSALTAWSAWGPNDTDSFNAIDLVTSLGLALVLGTIGMLALRRLLASPAPAA